MKFFATLVLALFSLFLSNAIADSFISDGNSIHIGNISNVNGNVIINGSVFSGNQTNTIDIEETKVINIETLSRIAITSEIASITILPTTEKQCTISLHGTIPEDTDYIFKVNSQNNTLTILTKISGNLFGELFLTIYLPQKEYETVTCQTISQDIELSENTFQKVNVTSTSGSIYLSSISASDIYLESVSGDIEIEGMASQNFKTTLITISGNIDCFLDAIQNADITVSSISGKIRNKLLQNEKGYVWNGTLSTISGDIFIHSF